jgi:hypothetical protein
MSRYKDHECLKTRTLHVKGVLPEDRTGLGIEAHFNNILKRMTYGISKPGKVTSVLVVPDFTAQLEIEGKIQEMKDLKMLLSVQEPGIVSCLIPRRYLDPDAYDKQMEEYEMMLNQETLKPF